MRTCSRCRVVPALPSEASCMHAALLLGLLAGAALPADPDSAPAPAAAVGEPPWKARLSVGVRAASLDSPQQLGLSFFSDALLELRLFDQVALQVGTWPFVVPVAA